MQGLLENFLSETARVSALMKNMVSLPFKRISCVHVLPQLVLFSSTRNVNFTGCYTIPNYAEVLFITPKLLVGRK